MKSILRGLIEDFVILSRFQVSCSCWVGYTWSSLGQLVGLSPAGSDQGLPITSTAARPFFYFAFLSVAVAYCPSSPSDCALSASSFCAPVPGRFFSLGGVGIAVSSFCSPFFVTTPRLLLPALRLALALRPLSLSF